MRVLLTVPPSRPRLHQLVPLCWALRAAGHEVQVAAPQAFAEDINNTGLVAVTDNATDYAKLWRPELVIQANETITVTAKDKTLKLDFTPPSLGGTGSPVRYIPYTGPSILPAWLRRKPRRPRILLTAGNITAVDGLNAEVICAANEVEPDTELPDNVRLVEDLPLAATLRTCTAVIHNGEEPLVLAALAEGLPQLAMTEQGLAARVAEQGAGTDNLHKLLDDSVRTQAERLRDELMAMPSPRDIVPRLTELCGAR